MDKKLIFAIALVIIVLAASVLLFSQPPEKAKPLQNDLTPVNGPATELPEENATNDTGEPVVPEEIYNPQLNPADFTNVITNPYYALTPGRKWVYEGETEDGTERNEVIVLNETKVIMGITTAVVWDRVWLDGELTEETYDWYAQDKDGNVWYLGEDSKEMADGMITSTAGSWEYGLDGAKPGIIMEANPQIGDSYRQEYYAGEAEDMADVVSLDESVTVPYGSFAGCLKTRDWTPLEPGADEYKYYCPAAGAVVLEVVIEDGEKSELIAIENLTEAPEPEEPKETIKTEITEEEARAIASAALEGTITDVAIETKYGKLAYVVEMRTSQGEKDVIIDIETGEIIKIES